MGIGIFEKQLFALACAAVLIEDEFHEYLGPYIIAFVIIFKGFIEDALRVITGPDLLKSTLTGEYCADNQ
jgi:hypothetical protein